MTNGGSNVAEEFEKVKAEVERLNTWHSILSRAWQTRAEKAEAKLKKVTAELAHWRPLIEAGELIDRESAEDEVYPSLQSEQPGQSEGQERTTPLPPGEFEQRFEKTIPPSSIRYSISPEEGKKIMVNVKKFYDAKPAPTDEERRELLGAFNSHWCLRCPEGFDLDHCPDGCGYRGRDIRALILAPPVKKKPYVDEGQFYDTPEQEEAREKEKQAPPAAPVRVTREIQSVLDERAKQDAKWGQQNHGPDGWLAILMEEVGKVARAILEGSSFKYRDELIQVAAVAIAALECLNRGNLELGSLVKAQMELKQARKKGIIFEDEEAKP